jgi:hypothetical protein
MVLGAAAAAVIAVVLVGPRLGERGGQEPPPVRGDSAAGAVAVVSPDEGATLREAPAFVWRPVPHATAYRISVTTETGDSVWASTTGDTAIAAPADAFPLSAVYYWYVDALMRDGSSIPGSAHEFRLSP